MASGILSPTHLLVVLVVALIVLGPKRLPGAGKAIGEGLREFKDSISGAVPTEEPAQIPSSSVLMTEPTPASVPVSAPSTASEPVYASAERA
jgi:sec-independent protein translocase protein TatA